MDPRISHIGLGTLLVLGALSCRKDRTGSGSEPASVSSVTAAEHPLPTATVQPDASNREMSQNMQRLVSYTGVDTPANAFFDRGSDRYLVSNVVGKLTAADKNGFISAFSPTGAAPQPRWIVSGQNGVTLDAPKGLAVASGVLYVADIDRVRAFDAASGAPRGEIPIPGATYLAGMAVGPDGRVLVADAGVKVKDNGDLDAVNGGAIWVVEGVGRAPTKVAATDPLGGPAALAVRPNGELLVATLVDGSTYVLDKTGKKTEERKAPRGKLDGVGEIENKIYVSSWEASALYRRIEGGTYAVQLTELRGPGGLAIDTKRNQVVLPLMTENRVDVYNVR
jgi:hypothetical protein